MKYWKTKYQLAEDMVIDIPYWPYGEVTTDLIIVSPSRHDKAFMRIKKYFCWDGPSGPAIDTPSFMEASLVHDAFYWLIRWGKIPEDYRSYADDLMYELCLKNGMCKIRAKWCCWGVKRFAAKAASSDNKRKIYETK